MMAFRRRKDGAFWLTFFGLHFSGQLCRWKGGPFAYVKWGSGDGAQLGIAFACAFALWFHWDIPWRASKRLPFLRGDYREFGLKWSGGALYFDFGREEMGSYWSRRAGRFGGLKAIWMNKQLHLWRNTWVIGRDKYTNVKLDERALVIDCGRWPGDSYEATQTFERSTWRNRFRTIERFSFNWSLPGGQHGIPVDTRGKYGDRYSEVFGFGAEDTGEGAPAILSRRLESLLKNWPEGLVADYADEGVPV